MANDARPPNKAGPIAEALFLDVPYVIDRGTRPRHGRRRGLVVRQALRDVNVAAGAIVVPRFTLEDSE